MKKRDLILDFTSLLDVIMILLFIVMSGMGQASMEVRKEAEKKIKEAEGVKQELSVTKDSLEELKKEEMAKLAENQALEEKVSSLLKENEALKALGERTEADEAKLYESLMEKSTKITLVCLPYIHEGKNEVKIRVYSGKGKEEQEERASVIFTHDFSLSREERLLENAKMQERMYQALEKEAERADTRLILVKIQYTYGDKNFSQSDLDVISGAVQDLERKLNKTCYIDKMKQ